MNSGNIKSVSHLWPQWNAVLAVSAKVCLGLACTASAAYHPVLFLKWISLRVEALWKDFCLCMAMKAGTTTKKRLLSNLIGNLTFCKHPHWCEVSLSEQTSKSKCVPTHDTWFQPCVWWWICIKLLPVLQIVKIHRPIFFCWYFAKHQSC